MSTVCAKMSAVIIIVIVIIIFHNNIIIIMITIIIIDGFIPDCRSRTISTANFFFVQQIFSSDSPLESATRDKPLERTPRKTTVAQQDDVLSPDLIPRCAELRRRTFAAPLRPLFSLNASSFASIARLFPAHPVHILALKLRGLLRLMILS